MNRDAIAEYFPDGDFIEFFFRKPDIEYYAEWLNPFVTLLRSQETDEIVGGIIEQMETVMKKAQENK